VIRAAAAASTNAPNVDINAKQVKTLESGKTLFQGKRPKRCRDATCRAAPYDCDTCPGPEEDRADYLLGVEMRNMTKNLKTESAVYKDDAVRCNKCETEIWEGVECDCGVDGEDHAGLTEAYEQKAKAEKGLSKGDESPSSQGHMAYSTKGRRRT
jgi:hypothetical protein